MKMKRLSLTLAALLAAPAGAATAPAAPDDFGCLVRTMYMAGAAEGSAAKETDAAKRENAMGIATESYEAASYFIGRMTVSRADATKARFDAEVASLSTLAQDALANQIAQCTGRAKAERAAFINPLASK